MIRPTTDRVKEAVFSILQSRGPFTDLAVLDLFAGTGGLGIEALSRGAASAVFVESSRPAIETIRANLTAAGFAGEVLAMPVARAVPHLGQVGRRFGGIFLDPPYDQGLLVPTLEQVDAAGLVEDGGWVVAEYGRGPEPPERVGAFVRRLHRCYGDSCIALFIAQRTCVPDSETADGNPE